MELFWNLIKSVVLGIVQGITEWLPISSTGHMLLLDEVMQLSVSREFRSMFFVVIQFGSILAVLFLYFHKLNPFSPRKSGREKAETRRGRGNCLNLAGKCGARAGKLTGG